MYWKVVSALVVLGLLAGCFSFYVPDTTLADRLMQEGNWEEAMAAYQDALKEDPYNPVIQAKLNAAKGRIAAAYQERGRAALKERKLIQAIEAFKRALSLEPSNPEHQSSLAQALRYKEAQDRLTVGQKMLKGGRLDDAAEAFERALELDPDQKAAQDGLVSLAEKQKSIALPLTGSKQPITLKFQNARTKEVFEVLARAGGINILFDKDVKDDPITIFVKDASFEDALNLILTTQGLFMRRLSADTILVIPRTKQKLDQYQDLMIRTFYLSNVKAKDAVNLLRTMLETKRIFVNEDLNAIVMRDSADKVKLAERIILANDRKPGEVVFEIEVLEVDKTLSDKFGVNIAKQAGAALVPPGTTDFPSVSSTTLWTYQQLSSIGIGSYLFTLPTSVLLDFLRTEATTKTLANPRIRVVNNKQAKINLGDKVPILLSTTSTIPGIVPGTVPTQSTVTSIEFKDTGVKLTVEPVIHLNQDVTLKLQLEVTRLGDLVVLQTNPLVQQFKFGTRTAETSLSLKDGESVVLAGLIQPEDRITVQKVRGLGDIPVLGEVFKSTTRDVITTDVILTITPHVVRAMELPSVDDQAFWSGTEEAYGLKQLFPDGGRGILGALPASPAPALPGAPSPAPEVPRQPPLGMLSFLPPDLTASVGQEIRLDVQVANIEDLAEGTLTISYDAKILEFRQAFEGEFLKREGTATVVTAANPATGTVAVRLMRGEGAKGVSGAGVLATLAFVAKEPGSSPVAIQTSQLLSAAKTPLSATGGQGNVRVQ
ncbi:MAG TPA: secretin N-terminal domain-containing protein [Nitrospirales bacterium]|nr:secretin N-terminal domain-containing protein [Nitrospirales bacterium]